MKTYEKEYRTWKELQQYLPLHNRITEDIFPIEKYRRWENIDMHIDYYPRPFSRIKIIILHGVGGNGRLLSFIGIPLYKNGYEVICPDLPGYGITNVKVAVDYYMWVNFVKDLVEYEIKKDSRPIVLFGLSAGGMLAYHAGCNNENISGLIFTNLLDQRLQEVRDSSAINKYISRIGIYGLSFLEKINGKIKLPVKMIVNMKSISNNDDVSKLLLSDKISAGAKIPIKFITSMIKYNPEVEPKRFHSCPILLVHPQNDRWSDLSLSKKTFDKFNNVKKDLKLLDNAGHFPIEQPGLRQLERYVINFIEENINIQN